MGVGSRGKCPRGILASPQSQNLRLLVMHISVVGYRVQIVARDEAWEGLVYPKELHDQATESRLDNKAGHTSQVIGETLKAAGEEEEWEW